MKERKRIAGLLLFLLLAISLSGCGQEGGGRAVQAEGEERSGDGHDGAEGAGASFQEGKGIVLLEETQKSLGVELEEVKERPVWPEIRLTAQIYRGASEASRVYGRERQGNAYATALVGRETAAELRPGQKVRFVPKDGEGATAEGVVWKIDLAQAPVLGKAEVLLEIPDGARTLEVGEFVEMKAPVGNSSRMLVSIPRSAVLETSTGTHVFVRNGRHLLRTEIKTGAGNNDYVEVTEGLYDGDVIAVRPVEALYLIELRATKGGGHCH